MYLSCLLLLEIPEEKGEKEVEKVKEENLCEEGGISITE
jgi:hypothetical protein